MNEQPKLKPLAAAIFMALTMSPAYAQEGAQTSPDAAAPELPVVEVRAGRDPIDTRRESPASKLVYDRQDLERYNENTVGDVLRKLPGISFGGPPGRSNDIRMRGFEDGYTQVLIDGERSLGGDSERQMKLDLLSADMIERIEIIRNPVAEYDANGIAGTVNIVLRELPDKSGGAFRLGANRHAGETNPQFSAQYHNSDGSFSYLLSGSYVESFYNKTKFKEAEQFNTSGARTSFTREAEDERSETTEYSFAPRLQWKRGADTFAFEPFLLKNDEEKTKRLDKSKASPATSSNFIGDGFNLDDEDKEREVYRLRGTWRRKLALGETEWRLTTQAANEDKEKTKLEYNAAGALTKTTLEPGRKEDRDTGLHGKWTAPLGDHLVSLGGGAVTRSREDTKTKIENGVTKAAGLGDVFNITEDKLVLWTQDQWQLTSAQVLTPGLRVERVTTESTDGAGVERSGTAYYTSPSLHYLWQMTPATNLRASAARSFRPPKFDDLSNVVITASGTNSSTNSDKSGNPDLEPEAAWGYELGVERFFRDKKGYVGLNGFYRDIDDKIEKVTALEDGGRYVERPQNVGDAKAWGAELDGKLRMDAIGLPRLALTGNYTWLRSELTDFKTGEERKLKEQPEYVSNVGFTYDVNGVGLSFGANYNRQGRIVKEDSATKFEAESRIERLDAFVSQTLGKHLALRLSATNIGDAVKEKDKREYHDGGALKKIETEREESGPTYYLTLEGHW